MILFCALGAMAQGKGKDKEAMRREIREYKMKYLAQEMELNAETQKPFFELYDKLEDERDEIMKEPRRLDRQVKADKNASEEDYARAAEAIAAAKIKVSEVEKAYDERFAEFLTAKQIYKMHEAEESFRQKMRQMRDKKRTGHSAPDKKKRGEEM